MNPFDDDEIIEITVNGVEYCMPRGEYRYLIEKLRQFDSHFRPQLPVKPNDNSGNIIWG